MAILAYCIVLDDCAGALPAVGIFNSQLLQVAEAGLSAISSQIEKTSISSANFQQAALEFHNVVHAIFRQTAVVPFRFPTWLSQAELRQHLRSEAMPYRTFLSQHANHVQMEARIRLAPSEQAAVSATGTEHLRARALHLRMVRETAEQTKQAVFNQVIEWRERETPDGLRLYALVERGSIAAFREKLSQRDIVRVSGPWPATEFLESKADRRA